MKAAMVQALGTTPSVGDFREPVAEEGETIVDVSAAPLSPIVRSLVAGRHYASGGAGAFVPGVDGVGRDASGRRVYFLFPRAPFGSMAERSVVSKAMTVPVPDALTDDRAAAIATAGLASWVALTRRAPIHEGATVLVNGATGAAGAMALQTARHFGARRVIAVGRDERKLSALEADVRVPLDAGADVTLRECFDAGVDVVLDFVWGEPASRVLTAATRGRGRRAGEPRLRFVQIGTAAGDELALRGDMFRSTGLELLGSGIGSVSVAELLAGAGELLAAAPAAGFEAPFDTAPLDSIAEVWDAPGGVRRLVTPGRCRTPRAVTK